MEKGKKERSADILPVFGKKHAKYQKAKIDLVDLE